MTLDNFHCEAAEWRPLESILAPEKCAAFIYMGWLELGDQRLHHYKHAVSRRYLFVTDELETYGYLGGDLYVPVARKDAIRCAWEEPC
ncbi:MAG: hypothetical protein ACRDKS_03345 [Actinomycetota bacterium]